MITTPEEFEALAAKYQPFFKGAQDKDIEELTRDEAVALLLWEIVMNEELRRKLRRLADESVIVHGNPNAPKPQGIINANGG